MMSIQSLVERVNAAYLDNLINCMGGHCNTFVDMFDMSFYGASKGTAFIREMRSLYRQAVEGLCFTYQVKMAFGFIICRSFS